MNKKTQETKKKEKRSFFSQVLNEIRQHMFKWVQLMNSKITFVIMKLRIGDVQYLQVDIINEHLKNVMNFWKQSKEMKYTIFKNLKIMNTKKKKKREKMIFNNMWLKINVSLRK